MSGDVQPRKRKDKKRKKDDEDTVKETPAPKVTAGAAQAATQPGDIQMHVHNDHGTGGHWCAKVVFFILLTGLGALIGLIILENRGVSNADTPLSESRYAEYFDGWVDENREDDHHHEEILEALNQLDEHEDEDEAHGEADDHGDEEDEDDGAPYAEEEDHDDERDLQDEEDEGELPKLDDDEVEEIVATEKKVAQQEARAAADNDDDDDEPVATGNANDDDDDDEPDNQTAEDDDDENDSIAKEINQLAEDDDDDDTVEGNSPFDEENQTNALNDHVNKSTDGTVLRKEREIEKTVEVEAYAKDETPADPMVSAEVLKTQMDELVNTYNKLAEKMNLPKEEPFDKVGTKHVNNKDDDDQVNDDTFSKKAVNDKDDGDQDDDEDDDEDNFENFVDNDGGEEEYLAKLRKEQEQRNQQKQQEEKDEPREESSHSTYQHTDGSYPSSIDEEQEANLMSNLSERLLRTEMAAANLVEKAEIIEELLSPRQGVVQQPRSVMEDFVNAAGSGLGGDDEEIIEGNVILIEGDDGELYSGDEEYDYEPEDDYGEELEEIEEEEEYEEEEQKLIEQELEIGSFVPTTFEEFSSMYRAPSSGETNESIPVLPEAVPVTTQSVVPEPPSKETPKTIHKESPLMKKKPPKGALNKLIYGLHKEPLITAEDLQQSIEQVAASASQSAKEKHVEFILPEQVSDIPLPEEELPMEVPEDVMDNGSKENLFIPYDDEGDIEDSYEDELLYEDEEELDSVLLRQYPSDEEEEPFSDDELSDVDDSELMKRLEEKYGKLEVKKDPAAQQPEDGDEEEDSWTKIPSRPSESQIYEEELNRARRHLDELKNPKKALEEYETLLRKSRRLVPALVGKARALDVLAEQKQSNSLLSEAIGAYRDVVLLGDAVDDETARTAGERCIDRSRFRGQYLQVIDVHQELIRRFDSEPKYRNQLAVTYLLANRLPEAKAVLHETLMRWIDDGFALVHYGFVLKNLDKDMELAAQYLREGIETEQEGTQDGRFYFHLGDALQRLGRQQEALDVYRKGAEKKLFLSMYQRSLYNVDSLKSRPFWTVEQTTFAAQLELIQSQWTGIRDEGLKLLNSAGNFKDEAENLRDTGDWKQFELFFRGYRIDKNCAKAPLTCRLVEQFTAARSCKRGQVKFSVMHPGTHVWPHCGPTNCRIRAHLGLKVPSGTFIRVAEETRSWENGKWLIFDDSFEHEVWHNGTSTRLVLIVDFWHPDLTESQRKSLSPI
ncbi:aspartyl/asparaginyl beta-hydroxylase isoform X3 [Aedes aegypti]|uniref:Aspartyl/asparaginy/proline hydroxylase domain-containing protein n=1 Tax=Aedes aegypti TaxID=7159 RepID=A0A6I8TV25_AEDAE|nr:aspartyl/asparaginyl beta-hydroxylase isoform X3 [Aedes aegypti]